MVSLADPKIYEKMERILCYGSNPDVLTVSAFTKAQQEHPNYGKATGMGPTQWWSNVSMHVQCLHPAATEFGRMPRVTPGELLVVARFFGLTFLSTRDQLHIRPRTPLSV